MSSVKEAFFTFSAAAMILGLKVNEEKTKFMQITKRPINIIYDRGPLKQSTNLNILEQ
jgi:hypothetical protein